MCSGVTQESCWNACSDAVEPEWGYQPLFFSSPPVMLMLLAHGPPFGQKRLDFSVPPKVSPATESLMGWFRHRREDRATRAEKALGYAKMSEECVQGSMVEIKHDKHFFGNCKVSWCLPDSGTSVLWAFLLAPSHLREQALQIRWTDLYHKSYAYSPTKMALKYMSLKTEENVWFISSSFPPPLLLFLCLLQVGSVF